MTQDIPHDHFDIILNHDSSSGCVNKSSRYDSVVVTQL
jgi:hypothetical protein